MAAQREVEAASQDRDAALARAERAERKETALRQRVRRLQVLIGRPTRASSSTPPTAAPYSLYLELARSRHEYPTTFEGALTSLGDFANAALAEAIELRDDRDAAQVEKERAWQSAAAELATLQRQLGAANERRAAAERDLAEANGRIEAFEATQGEGNEVQDTHPTHQGQEMQQLEEHAQNLEEMLEAGCYIFARQLRYPHGWPNNPSGQGPQEKGIDVRMALDIALLAQRGEYDVALTASGLTPRRTAISEKVAPVQEALARAGTEHRSAAAPYWMAEGMAWYLGALYEQSREPPDAEADPSELGRGARARHFFKSRDYLLWQARRSTDSLRSMEEGDVWDAGVGYLAVEGMVGHSDSEQNLFQFYRNLVTAPSWQTAFATTFGITVDDAYWAFEYWRARVAPPLSYYTGVVRGPDGDPLPGTLVGALRSVGGDMDSYDDDGAPVVLNDRSADDGTFRVLANPGLAVLVIGTDACRDIAFLGEDGELTRDPDEARRFVIELEGVSGIEVRLPRAPSDLCRSSDDWSAGWAIGWPPEWTSWITWDYAGQFLPWNP